MSRYTHRRFTGAAIASLVMVAMWLMLIGTGKPAPKAAADPTVNRLADDFRRMQIHLDGFHQRYRAWPGDYDKADTLDCDPPCKRGNGDGAIEGLWNSLTPTDESWLLWSHLHGSKLRIGSSGWVAPVEMDPYVPKNALGGRLGVTSKTLTTMPIAGMSNGEYFVCSSRIPGKTAQQLDALLDDGDTAAGQLQMVPEGSEPRARPTALRWWNGWWQGRKLYTVCMLY